MWQVTYAGILSLSTIRSVLEEELGTGDAMRPFLVAVRGQEVLGYADCRVFGKARYADLTHLYVRPDFQGRGIGSRLLAASFAAVRDQGIETVRTMVAKANERAIRFYSKWGFSVIREFVAFAGEQMVPVVEMSVSLDGPARTGKIPGNDFTE